jgi:hypothetical protein
MNYVECLFVLSVVSALLSVSLATPCPLPNVTSFSLASNTSYSFLNCSPMNVSGANLSNVLVAFVGTPVETISIVGFSATNLSLFVSDANSTLQIRLDVSSVRGLSIAVARCFVTSSISFDFVRVDAGFASDIFLSVMNTSLRTPDHILRVVAYALDNVSVSVVGSSCSVVYAAVYAEGRTLLQRLQAIYERVAVAGSYVLQLEGPAGLLLQSIDLSIVKESTISVGSVFVMNSPKPSLDNLSVYVSGSDITASDGVLKVCNCANNQETAPDGNVSGVSLMIRRSSISIRFLLSITNVSETIDASVWVVDSNVSTSLALVSFKKMPLIRDVFIHILDSTTRATTSIFILDSIEEIGGYTIMVCDSSNVTMSISPLLASTFALVRNSMVTGSINILLNRTFMRASVASSFFYALSFVNLFALKLRPSSTICASIYNSRVILEQAEPGGVDSASFFATVALESPRSDSIFFVVDRSVLELSCSVIGTLMITQQSQRMQATVVVTHSSVMLFTRAEAHVLPVFGLLGGSLLVGVLNSVVNMLNVTISDTTFTCGVVCQIMRVHSQTGFWNDFTLQMTIGFAPPAPSNPQIFNTSLHLRRVSMEALPAKGSGTGRLAGQMMSFLNTSGSSVVLEGPMNISGLLFRDLLLPNDRPIRNGHANLLQLLNCETIFFEEDAGLRRLSAADVASEPFQGFVVVQSLRSGGSGSCGLTPTASELLRSASLSQTLSSSDETPSLSMLPPSAPRTLSLRQRIVGGAVGIAAVVSGPTGAASLQTLHAQLRVASCGAAASDNDPPLDFGSNPIQLQLGVPLGQDYRGAVVGNIVLLAALGLLGLAIKRLRPTTALSHALPGLLYVPYGVLAVPTMMSSVALITINQSRADVALGVAGSAVVFAPLAALVAWTTCKFVAVASPAPRRHSRFLLADQLFALYSPSTAYDAPSDSLFVAEWEFSGATDYVKNRQVFALLEHVLGLATGVTSGMTVAGGVSLCANLNRIQLSLCLAELLLIVAVRPHARRADLLNAGANATIECLAALFFPFDETKLFISIDGAEHSFCGQLFCWSSRVHADGEYGAAHVPRWPTPEATATLQARKTLAESR